MKRIGLLLILALLLASCGENEVTGEVVADLDEDGTDKEIERNTEKNTASETIQDKIKQALELKGPDTDEEWLADFENQQQEIFAERNSLLIEKRKLLDEINTPGISFADRKFYQKALDIVRAKESEFTLQATILETRIKGLTNKIEGGDSLTALRARLDDYISDKDEYFEQLREAGMKILEIREKYSDKDLTEVYDNMKEEIQEFEQQEVNLINKIDDIKKKINSTSDKIKAIVDWDFSGDIGALYSKRNSVSEELSVVRNLLVEAYLDAKRATGLAVRKIEKKIDDFETQEKDLKRELRAIDRDIQESE